MATTTKIQWPKGHELEKPTFLTIEDHSNIKLKDALSQVSESSNFKEYLRIGIINQNELQRWKHQKAMTILDKENNTDISAIDMPAPGSVIEKIYANKKTTPVEYRRNREWTDYNWRRPEEW